MAYTLKGEPRTHAAGRVKGQPNKLSRDLRTAILAAARRCGGGRNGLIRYLQRCADDEDPRVKAAFLSLLGRCVPREVSLQAEGTLVVVRDFTRVVIEQPATPVLAAPELPVLDVVAQAPSG